jgi:hypothetical protein
VVAAVRTSVLLILPDEANLTEVAWFELEHLEHLLTNIAVA